MHAASHPTPRPTPLDPPAVALAIAAHPDDVEFCAGATLARWARHGTVVHHLICTDGSKGTWDASADIAALVERRQAEQRAAAAALGATGEVVFLGEVDGELRSTSDTVERICREIRRLRPDVVLAHDPWKRYRIHPDHRAAGFLAIDAVVAARDPHFFAQQGFAHHRPEALLLFEADEANHIEPADERSITAKTTALEAHRSQLETTHFYKLDDAAASTAADAEAAAIETALAGFRERERSKLAEAGAAFGVDYGEAFHLIVDQL